MFFHLSLFLAVCLISLQDFPIIFASSSTVLLHPTFGLPPPRLPCGSQYRASRAMSLGGLRSVWSSHPNSRRQISKSVLICLVLVHRSLFRPEYAYDSSEHLLIKTCNCFVIVLMTFHVLQPATRKDQRHTGVKQTKFRSNGECPRVPHLM
jgi:hypothetical protein